MPISLEIADLASDADFEAVLQPLVAFNANYAPSNYETYAIRLRDDATGEVVGGLFARKYYDWLFVELLFVPENGRGRGLGTGMLAEAEAFARAKGCIGLWLDTFSFQAPGFYDKLGFEVFGAIEDYPIGGRRIFYQKRLGAPRSEGG